MRYWALAGVLLVSTVANAAPVLVSGEGKYEHSTDLVNFMFVFSEAPDFLAGDEFMMTVAEPVPPTSPRFLFSTDGGEATGNFNVTELQTGPDIDLGLLPFNLSGTVLTFSLPLTLTPNGNAKLLFFADFRTAGPFSTVGGITAIPLPSAALGGGVMLVGLLARRRAAL